MQIQTILMRFKAIDCKFEPLERDSNHWNANLNHSNEIRSNQMQIRTIQDSNHLNANSNHWNEIRSNQMQIQTIRKGF